MILAAAVVGATAEAGGTADCASIRHEALAVDLTTLGSETRSIQLRVGETLRFSFGTEPGPFGTLALVEGPGAPLILLAGAARTDVSFTAPENGAFTFRFGKAGEDAARFTVSCPAGRATYRAEASASPQASNFLPLQPEEIDATGLASEDLKVGEPSVGAQGQPAKNALPPIAVPPGVSLATPQTTRPQIKLSWLDQRYQPSGQGDPQIDPAESGVEIGLNYRLKSAVTIGALAQVNPAIDVPFGVERGLADRGWMAGPVTKIELAPKLLLDARAAWGEGESGPEEATSAAAAQRRLLSARLASEQVFGGWRLTPSVNFNYLEQLPHGFVPETEAAHPIGTGRIDMAPELAYHIDLPAAAFIEPRAVVGGFWDFDNLSKVAPSGAVHPEMRLKAEAGVTIGVRDGAKLQASGGLEGGDREVPDAWTGRLQLSVPLK